LRNDGLERALEETWRNKEKFYEDTKGLSTLEIIKKIESKYRVQVFQKEVDWGVPVGKEIW